MLLINSLSVVSSNVPGAFLASLNQFANENITSQVFSKQLENALDNMTQQSEYWDNEILKRQVSQVARAFDDPVLQDTLRNSFDDIRQNIADTINNSVDASSAAQINTLKTVLTNLGKLAGPAGIALSAYLDG